MRLDVNIASPEIRAGESCIFLSVFSGPVTQNFVEIR